MDTLSAFAARSLRGDDELIMRRHDGQERSLLIGSQLGRRPSTTNGWLDDLLLTKGFYQ